ncbi:hypothetical protein BH11MYX2_BH11MYX2_36190 [soil metagenome]
MRRVYLEYLGDSIELPYGETVLGRDTGCMMRFNDASVSRRHLKFIRHPESILVEDLGSSNGTLVNGERLRGSRTLAEGDTVKVGSRVLTIRSTYDEALLPSTLVLDEPGSSQSRRAFTSVMGITAPPPMHSPERRRDERHWLELPILYVSQELELETVSRDLSTAGVFVCSTVLDPIGTHCQLTLLVDGGPPLVVAAVVRRVVHQANEDQQVGLGVEFTKLSDSEIAWLEAVLDRTRATRPA